MAFCKFYSQKIQDKLVIDTKFFSDFLPDAPGDAVKVYLYGLYSCNDKDNTIEQMSNNLNMDANDIVEYMWYWHEQGLVNVVDDDTIRVSFLPLDKSFKVKKYSDSKYEQFNIIVQDIFESSRMITPTEYQAYYELVEVKKIEIPALIMIIKFCVDFKGKSVNYPYIQKVVTDWTSQGITTSELVEEQIEKLNSTNTELKDVLTILGIKRQAYVEDKQLYLKWTKDFKINYLTICYISKQLKKSGGMKELDRKLCKYYELNLFSEKEIKDYEENKNNSFEIARSITRNLGIYYSDLNSVIENYIIEWKKLGFDDQMLNNISVFCFKNNYKTLNNMDTYLKKLYKLGINSSEKFNEYVSQILALDKNIAIILEKLGLVRDVNLFDRRMYKIWTEEWQLSEELIEHAIKEAYTTNNPMQTMNKLLADYHTGKISSINQAKALPHKTYSYSKSINDNIIKSPSFAGDLNALFDNLDEVEL